MINNQEYINSHISHLINNNEVTTDEYDNFAVGNSLQQLLDFMSSEEETVFSTGISIIDDLLNGGITPATLTVIGGLCGMGKTTLALQIAYFLSSFYEKDVLFIAGEMSYLQLQAKLLSHLSYQIVSNNNLDVEALSFDDIFNPKKRAKLSMDKMNLLFRASEKLQDNKHLYIRPMVGHTTIPEIENAINYHIEKTGRIPIVIMDYIQIIEGKSSTQDAKAVIDNAMHMFNRIAHDNNTPILLLSSLGRSAYNSPNISAAKGSGEIEYTCSNFILLTPAESKQPAPTVSTRGSSRTSSKSTQTSGIKVLLTLAKARFGEKDKTAQLIFQGKYNTFI